MGNSNTKESREGSDGLSDRRAAGDPSAVPGRESNRDPGSRSRNRMSRPDLSLLGLSTHSSSRDRDRPDAPFEHRETRQEREARRLERERALRAKERERSLREEHVDGGYLVTLGVYTGTEDFSKPVVRQLQLERKLAPFWRGLNDWSDSWAEHQLVAAARGLPIPAADAPPDPELMPRPPPVSSSPVNMNNLTVPIGPRTLSAASDNSASGTSALPSPVSPGPSKGIPFKPRAKALAAALSVGSRNASSTDLAPKEINLAHDPFVNGQPLEVFLYKDASECPICFLSYPPYLNSTRCCDQPICSECFVQIKRAEPHLPEHHPDGQARDPNEGLTAEDPPEMLISTPSACPYCQQPEFGVTYEPPPFRRGLAYASTGLPGSTAMSSQTSLNATSPGATTGRRRTHSLSATAPNVITTDRVRPDWATKLAAARAHQARRAAAATALHTAAFLVGGNEQRSILRPGRFSRRNTGNAGAQANPGQPDLEIPEPDRGTSTHHADGSRRTRMEELEEMMFLEAVRLSLASEQDRRKKEEKALRKEAKAREKEERKALKKQGRDPYGGHTSGASGSSLSLGLGRRRGNSAASNLRMEATVLGASHAPAGLEREDTADSFASKGKAVDRGLAESAGEGSSSAASLPIPTGSGRTGSHLRQMSNASSLGSSLADTPAGSFSAGGYAGPEGGDTRSGGHNTGSGNDDGDRDTGNEPMFNFRSLAEIVGVNIDDGSARRPEWEENDSPVGSAPARPLSQVKEDDMEEAEAEHVEGNTGALGTQEVTVNTSTNKPELQGYKVATPELTITPETPAIEGAPSELKRLGESSVTEPTRQAS